MRILRGQGKLLLLALLAMFAVPSLAQADHGRRGRDRGRVVVYAEVGRRNYDDGYYREGWRHGRKVGWGDYDLPPGLAKKRYCRERYEYYPVREHYPRRGGVTVQVRIPF
jgi:hypothetical protein